MFSQFMRLFNGRSTGNFGSMMATRLAAILLASSLMHVRKLLTISIAHDVVIRLEFGGPGWREAARGGGHGQSVGYGQARSLGYNADIRGCTGASHRPNSTDKAPNRIISTIMIGKS